MGGSAFASDNTCADLFFPRLQPTIYDEYKHLVEVVLRDLFAHVQVPHEAPEKKDHGDIDFLVHEPLTVSPEKVFSTTHNAEVKNKLAAIKQKSSGPGQQTLAIRVPPLDSKDAKACIQVDLTHCPTLDKLDWMMLTHSYGDLFQILGVNVRPLGFKFKPEGLAVVIPRRALIDGQGVFECDAAVHSKKSLEVLLSCQSEKVLEFLGLNKQQWSHGFATLDELHCWVANNRLFDCRVFQQEEDTIGDDYDAGNPLWNGKQKNRERKRKHKRPNYASFLDEWLPQHPVMRWPGISEEAIGSLRLAKLNDAVCFFGKELEYANRLERLRGVEREHRFWELVKQRLPLRGPSLGVAIKGLHRWVGFDIAQLILVSESATAADMSAFVCVDRPPWIRSKHDTPTEWTNISGLNTEELLKWVDQNWRECWRLQHEYEKAQHKLRTT